MDAQRYARLNEIFAGALAAPTDERDAFVADACDGDTALRREVHALLARAASEDDPDEPLSEPQIDAVREGIEAAFAPPAFAAPTAVPEAIGRYRIVRRIATGGMGVVYEAQQDAPRRRVALKLIPASRATPERLRRFRQEAEVLGRLHHPGIAQIHEAGTFDLGEGAQPFFAMEYVDGVDARTHAERAGLDASAKLRLVADICDAVHYAHDKGVIHRDLKPDNVFIDEHEHVKVLDFGVARAGETSTAISTVVTHEGQIIGTLAYMAPEQLSADPEKVTPRADVYALGVMAFELLTGRLPHDLAGMPTTAAIHAMTETDAPPLGRFDPAYRGDVETIVGTALDKEPTRRYPSAAALAADIRRFLDHEPIAARPPSRSYRMRKFARRNRVLVGGTAATLVTLAVGMIVAIFLGVRATNNAIEANHNEIRMAAGVQLSAQILVESDKPLRAREQLDLVPERVRGWAWNFLAIDMPHVVPGPLDEEWAFLDDDHLFRFDTEGQRVLVYSIVDRGVPRAMLEDMGIEWFHFARSGFVLGRRGSETLLLDVWNERVVDQWACEPPGHQLGSIGDEGRVVILADAGVARVMVDGQAVRELEAAGNVRHSLSPDGKLVAINTAWPSPGEPEKLTSRVMDVATWKVVYETTRDRLEQCRTFNGGFLLGVGRRQQGDGEKYKWKYTRVDRGVGGLVRHERVLNKSEEYLRISDDGNVASISHPTRTRLLDTRTGKKITGSRYLRTGDWVDNVGGEPRVAPSGSRVAIRSTSVGGTWIIDLDEAETEEGFDHRSRPLRGHSSWIYHLAVSNDGSLIASAAPDDPLVRVWDSVSGEAVATLGRRCQVHGSWDAFMAFSTDDRRLVLTTPFVEGSSPRGIRVVDWDLLHGTVDAAWPDEERSGLNHVPWLDDFIDVLRPAPRARLSQRAQMLDETARLVWLPASAHDWFMPEHARAGGRRWSLAHGAPSPSDSDWPCGISIHPSEPLVATVSAVATSPRNRTPLEGRGRLRVTHARTGEVVADEDLPRQPWCIAYSPDGSLLAIGTNPGRVLVFETTLHTMQLDFAAHAEYVYSLAWLDDDRLVTASGDATLRVWDPRPRRVREAEEQQWRALRAEMAARSDLAEAIETMTGDERAAARIELIRRNAPSGDS